MIDRKALGKTHLDGILPWREMRLLLPLLLRHSRGIVLGKTATNGARALGTQIERQVFLVMVEDA